MRDFLLLLFSVPLLSFFWCNIKVLRRSVRWHRRTRADSFAGGLGGVRLGYWGFEIFLPVFDFRLPCGFVFFFVRNMLESCVGRLRHCRRDFLLKNS